MASKNCISFIMYSIALYHQFYTTDYDSLFYSRLYISFLYISSLYKKDSTRAISLPTLDKTQCAVQKQKQTVETQIPYDSRISDRQGHPIPHQTNLCITHLCSVDEIPPTEVGRDRPTNARKDGNLLNSVLFWSWCCPGLCLCGRVSEARERMRMIFMIIALGMGWG